MSGLVYFDNAQDYIFSNLKFAAVFCYTYLTKFTQVIMISGEQYFC